MSYRQKYSKFGGKQEYSEAVTVMALTDTKIKNANPKDRQYKLSDSGGLYLLISPKGGKWWRFDYRFNGLRKTISLGLSYPHKMLIKINMLTQKFNTHRHSGMVLAGIQLSYLLDSG